MNQRDPLCLIRGALMNKLFFVFLMMLSVSAFGGEYKSKFDRAGESMKANMCGPVLIKMYDLMSIATVMEKNKDHGYDQSYKIALNIGYRGETFNMMSKKLNPNLNKQLWEESALAGKDAKEDYFAIGKVCVDLYNQQRRLGLIDVNVEKTAINKITADLDKSISK